MHEVTENNRVLRWVVGGLDAFVSTEKDVYLNSLVTDRPLALNLTLVSNEM